MRVTQDTGVRSSEGSFLSVQIAKLAAKYAEHGQFRLVPSTDLTGLNRHQRRTMPALEKDKPMDAYGSVDKLGSRNGQRTIHAQVEQRLNTSGASDRAMTDLDPIDGTLSHICANFLSPTRFEAELLQSRGAKSDPFRDSDCFAAAKPNFLATTAL